MAFNTLRASILWEHLGEPFHFHAQVLPFDGFRIIQRATFEV